MDRQETQQQSILLGAVPLITSFLLEPMKQTRHLPIGMRYVKPLRKKRKF